MNVTRAEHEYLTRQRALAKLQPWEREMVEAIPDHAIREIVRTAKPVALPVVPATGGRLPQSARETPLGPPPGIDLVDAVAKGFAARELADAEVRAAELADRRHRLMAKAKAAAMEAEKAISEAKVIEEALEAQEEAEPKKSEPVSADPPRRVKRF